MELNIERLSKTYPNGVQALKDVSLTIPTGMFGLVGPNGAGKTTLMRTIATLQEPDAGTISFDGIDVLRQRQALRKSLGYLPQEFGLYPNLTATTILDHFATLKGITVRRERRATVRAVLEQTNLYADRGKKVGGFSGGMKQRLGIAIALIGHPRLIIVDEPTAGLDPTERRRFLNLLSEIGEDIVVILSTHIVDDVRELCAKVAILDHGEVVVAGVPEELIAEVNGRIWQRAVAKSELESFRRRYRVISTRLLAGRPVLRVYAETIPDDGFTQVAADLEDVYFLHISDGTEEEDAR
ncbi:MAG: ABC transporter ATP-binding protein [bacterium]|nr:ABC transporter ATP-binding protein [bacterium]